MRRVSVALRPWSLDSAATMASVPLLLIGKSRMADLPTGTVTLLFTDIEHSTQLLQRLGARYGDVLAEYRALLRSIFQAHDGHEVDTQGDSFFVAFPRAVDAVQAAVAIQRALAAHPWPEDVTMATRMGVHTG